MQQAQFFKLIAAELEQLGISNPTSVGSAHLSTFENPPIKWQIEQGRLCGSPFKSEHKCPPFETGLELDPTCLTKAQAAQAAIYIFAAIEMLELMA